MKATLASKCPPDRLEAADNDIVMLRLTEQYRTIDMEWGSRHRNHAIKYIVGAYDKWRINEIRVIIVFLSTGWWIVADDPAFDHRFKDLGPFDMVTEAIQVADSQHKSTTS